MRVEDMSDRCLEREAQRQKDIFGPFAFNAARRDRVAEELRRRGRLEIPNVFGPISVRTGNTQFVSGQAAARRARLPHILGYKR